MHKPSSRCLSEASMSGRKEVIQIKTRAEIYGQEATELLRLISMYPGISGRQLCRFYPGQEGKIKTLLAHLEKQGRIVPTRSGEYFLHGRELTNSDNGMLRAIWVLLDFIDRVEFHSSGDFLAKILFFSNGELYEIVCVACGQEALVTHAITRNEECGGRRIVLIDDPEQIEVLDFPDISGFCTVDESGKVSYYKKMTEREM